MSKNIKKALLRVDLMTVKPADIDDLIDKGADVNAKDENNSTLMHHAAASGRQKIVQRLRDRGAKINCQDVRGYTPLMYTNMQNMMDTLLKNDADINMQDNNGNTRLNHAIYDGDAFEVDYLLNKGARTDILNHDNIDSLDYARIQHPPRHTKYGYKKSPVVLMLEEHESQKITTLRTKIAKHKQTITALQKAVNSKKRARY